MARPALTHLGPYQLFRNLPRPGRAEVYLGRHVAEHAAGAVEWPETAVIKVLRPPEQVDKASEPRVREAMARFVEEGRLGTRLRHPAITRTFGVGLDKRQKLHFIVQEHLEGISLSQLLEYYASQETLLPYNVLLQLVTPILKALHYAYHEALREDGRPLRVVHRDIKPANVMLTYDGRVLLLDFAAARSTSFTRQETVQDVLVGTAHYLSPEQVFNPEIVGHATDIFAASVILFELCTLHPLLPRTRRFSEIAAALGRFNFVDHKDQIDHDRYPGLADVLAHGLSPDPETRFLTAGEMARELEGLALFAGDGPGRASFAAELRSRWEAGDASEQASASGPLREIRKEGLGAGIERISLSPVGPTPKVEHLPPGGSRSFGPGVSNPAGAGAAASTETGSGTAARETGKGIETGRSETGKGIAAGPSEGMSGPPPGRLENRSGLEVNQARVGAGDYASPQAGTKGMVRAGGAPSGQEKGRRPVIELVIAALVGFVAALVTLYFLLSM